jgi:predicted dehydrogenase
LTTVRAAVIGCGVQGTLHAQSLSALADVEVVAVCDTDPRRAAVLAKELSTAKCFATYQEALDVRDLDLVSICTMPNTHREIAIAAISRGCHVLCEKPMAMSAAEAGSMVTSAEQHGVMLGLGFNMRFTKSAQVIRRFLESGELGRPICARGHMLADDVPWWGRHYDRDVSGGGALAATAVHILDLVWWLAGKPRPLTATASTATLFPGKRGAGAPTDDARNAYSVEDIVFGHVRFENGFWMSVEGSWVWDRPGLHYGFDLVSEQGQARFEPLEVCREHEGRLTSLYGPEEVANDWPESVAAGIEAFVAAARGGPCGAVASGSDGLTVQALVDALYSSAASGREVEVAIPGPGDSV